MLHLLQLEWLKMYKNTFFRVMVILYAVLLPGFFLVGKSVLPAEPQAGVPISQSTIYGFPDVFNYLGYLGNWMVFFFLGFVAITSVAGEFSNRTLRQNIITGLSRTEYFMSKLWFVLAISGAAALYYALIALLLGFTHTDPLYASAVWKNIDYVPRYFLMCVGYMSFGLLLAVVIRRTAIVLFLYLAYGLFIEPLIRYVVHGNIVQHESIHWYPLNAFEDLAPNPIAEMADEFSREMGFSFWLSPTVAILLSSLYIGLFLFLGWRSIRTSDL